MTKFFSIFKEAPVKLKERKKKTKQNQKERKQKLQKNKNKNKNKIERKETLSAIVILNFALLPFL